MIIEISILFAFAAMLSWAFGDFFIQHSTRKIGNLGTLTVIGIVGTIGLIPFIFHDLKLLVSTPNLILVISLGLITFVTAMLDFEALKEGKLSIIDVIFEIELPVTVTLSMIFFKESLTGWQIAIVASMLLGMILIATKSFHHWKTRLEKGVLFAFFAAVLMGVVNFMTATSSKNISPIMAVWAPWVIFTVVCLLAIWQREGIGTFGKNIVQYKWLLLLTGFLDTMAWIFYALATYKYEIAIITAITECYPAVAMFLGLWLNKEKIKWYQYFGAILALGGSIILALTVGG